MSDDESRLEFLKKITNINNPYEALYVMCVLAEVEQCLREDSEIELTLDELHIEE